VSSIEEKPSGLQSKQSSQVSHLVHVGVQVGVTIQLLLVGVGVGLGVGVGVGVVGQMCVWHSHPQFSHCGLSQPHPHDNCFVFKPPHVSQP